MLPEDLKNEVIPKNILMIGPTGCGKTEIARRIAKLSQAPFIKVEATKYTEVGFHGKDVDQIIRDLVDVSIAMTKKQIKEGLKKEVITIVNDKLLNALVGAFADEDHKDNYRNLLKEGALEDRPIEIEIPARASGVGNNFTGDMSGNPNSIVISEIFRAVKGTRLLTHSLTYLLTYSLTHSLAHSLTHSLVSKVVEDKNQRRKQ
jgi:ATP-dependent HslUV protease ATP-binding subunit HslU